MTKPMTRNQILILLFVVWAITLVVVAVLFVISPRKTVGQPESAAQIYNGSLVNCSKCP